MQAISEHGMHEATAFVDRMWRDYELAPDGPDPRTQDWFLVDSNVGPTAISAGYLAVVAVGLALSSGAKRSSPLLKTVSALHNAFLLGLSLWMVVATLQNAYVDYGWASRGISLDTLFCHDARRSSAGMMNVLYVHYVSKAYEFGDTLLMLIKGNLRQVSFLHVYHHATTYAPVWLMVMRYGPGGDAWFCCFLNSLVHVFMYSYYLLTSFGVACPWKFAITYFQMTQFLLFIFQATYILWWASPDMTGCTRPRLNAWMLLIQCILFFFLFANFLVKNKNKKSKKA